MKQARPILVSTATRKSTDGTDKEADILLHLLPAFQVSPTTASPLPSLVQAPATTSSPTPASSSSVTTDNTSTQRPRPTSSQSASTAITFGPSSLPASTSAQSTATPSTSNDSAQSDQGRSLSGGAIAGVIVGSLAALLLLLLLICLCRRHRRRAGHAAFTMLDPESRTSEKREEMKAEGPSSRRASNRQMDANNLEEIEVLIGDEQALERASGEDRQTASLPPIMLQSPDSGESVRQCPSNSSLNTTGAVSAANTDSTKTRASLISQFPVYDRRPSDRSSDGGHGGENGAGGAAACPGGSGSTEPQSSENTGSGKTETGGHLFSAPPPRPPSRTRSVPASTLATNIGLGRPPSSPCGPRSPRLTSLPEVMGQAEGQSQRGLLAVSKSSSSVRLERNLSNRSSRTILGALAWMKGFAWLSPFFEKDSSTFDASEQDLENGETPLSAAQEGKVRPMDRLLPTAAPVMRETPGYRRVTTTAAAYDIQDLRDLSQRPSGPSNTELSEDNGSDDDEHRSFLESPHVRTPPVSVTQAPQGSSRWSRATLGQ